MKLNLSTGPARLDFEYTKDRKGRRITTVLIRQGLVDGPIIAFGTALCALEDKFVKKMGRLFAMRILIQRSHFNYADKQEIFGTYGRVTKDILKKKKKKK